MCACPARTLDSGNDFCENCGWECKTCKYTSHFCTSCIYNGKEPNSDGWCDCKQGMYYDWEYMKC